MYGDRSHLDCMSVTVWHLNRTCDIDRNRYSEKRISLWCVPTETLSKRRCVVFRQVTLAVEKETEKRQQEEEAWYRQEQLLTEAEEKRRRMILEEEQKLVAQRKRYAEAHGEGRECTEDITLYSCKKKRKRVDKEGRGKKKAWSRSQSVCSVPVRLFTLCLSVFSSSQSVVGPCSICGWSLSVHVESQLVCDLSQSVYD